MILKLFFVGLWGIKLPGISTIGFKNVRSDYSAIKNDRLELLKIKAKKWPIELFIKLTEWIHSKTISGQLISVLVGWKIILKRKQFLSKLEKQFLNWKFISGFPSQIHTKWNVCFASSAPISMELSAWINMNFEFGLFSPKMLQLYIWGSPGVKGGQKILKISQNL